MLRRALIAVFVLGAFAAPPAALAATAPTPLMPGVTSQREIQFTPHGPVVLHVLTGPRPGGLWGLSPALSDGSISGREQLTAIERRVSAGATVAGVNGDYFNAGDGRPQSILMQNGVLHSPANDRRSSLGIGSDGTLHVDRIGFAGIWQGRGQRRPLSGLNQPAPPDGISLFTPAWGPATPATPSALNAVVPVFPPSVPGADMRGIVDTVVAAPSIAIPPRGAVLVARGAAATRMLRELPAGSVLLSRVILNPDWPGIVDAIGGGPVLVKSGRAVFRAFEDFLPVQLGRRSPRTAVGQRADGSIVLVTVDGDHPGYSSGLTNFELAQALQRLGVVTGMALEGGASTSMAFEGSLLNRPSDRGSERMISDALLITYAGVYAPPPLVPVVSPNGDAVAERQTLAYKVVRRSVVTTKLVGPDGGTRLAQTGTKAPGTYTFPWAATKPNGSVEPEGAWRWVVTGVDDLGRSSTARQDFFLNNTLGFVRVTRAVALRRGARVGVAAFKLLHPARVTVRVETKGGLRVRTLVNTRLGEGDKTVAWDGRDSRHRRVYGGRYVLRIAATNEFGPVELTTPFTAKRR
ncbi:MAG: phosphodiester glycosidase family protein [Actinomycetota bacterium]|nr:phosphodiester glycosidase family protein [Actinomycetota bacterium]